MTHEQNQSSPLPKIDIFIARTRSSRNGHNAGASRTSDPLTMKAWSGYDAANWWSASRGYVYFPTLDSKRDLDSFTQYELRRRSRWLYVNSGLATRIIDGIAAMIGSLTPVPLTGNKDWNQLALKSFNNNAAAALVFDVAGKFNFWSAQPMLTALRLIDGDVLGVLTASESDIARMMFYEAHQIGNTELAPDDANWIDGIRVTPQNRMLLVRLLNDKGEKAGDIPASEAVFYCQYRRPGRARGEPAMRHAINHLLDRAETLGFLKAGAKNAAQIGYYVARQLGFSGSSNQLPQFGQGAVSQNLGDAANTKVMVEETYRGGKVPVLNPGEEIKMLLDQRPHPNQLEFLDHLVRDIAWGMNCAPDILWNMAKLGGATARYVLADAQQTLIEPNQELLADQFCSRFWVYYIAKELKRWKTTNGASGLPPCEDPEWWKHGWQPQQKLTVDLTRDGKLFIDMHKSGMITLKRYHASLGQNWQVETDEYLNERQYVVQSVMNRKIIMPDGTERPMTMEEAYPPEPGAINITERANVSALPEDNPTDLPSGQPVASTTENQ